MAFSTTPVKGHWALVYWLRPNGFKGSGLNDVTWGTACDKASSEDFVVEIDGNDTADTFKWSTDGGSTWPTANQAVAITGAAQTLSDSQTITFAATTGHTIGDRWHIGNLRSEACDESGATAQITEATHRLLKPDKVGFGDWTDSGGSGVININYVNGTATFQDDVGTAVTVTRNDGYVLEAELQELGYMQGWSLNINVDMLDASRCAQNWKEFIGGQVSATGSIDKLHIPNASLFEALEDCFDGTQDYFLLQLFTQEDVTNKDQTGTHIFVWCTFNSIGISSNISDLMRENIGFQVYGQLDNFVAAT
jgi:hypothetical protein